MSAGSFGAPSAAPTRNAQYNVLSTVPPRGQHVVAIDGLRAFAVAGVLYAHCVESASIFGHLGVQLFFTISGFLITRMLLDARGTGALAEAAPLRHFFIRRALRLWPIYYLMLTVALLFNWNDVQASAAWHVLYLTNVYLYVFDTWEPWIFDHLWSLDVEEHFYLFWPILIYFVDRRHLGTVILCLLASSWIGVLASEPLGWNGKEVGVDALLPFSLINLAAGGLLGLWCVQKSPLLRRIPQVGAIGTVGMLLLPLVRQHSGSAQALALPFEAMMWVGLVHHTVASRSGLLIHVLTLRPLVYLGSISYGIYLYHAIVIFIIGEYVFTGIDVGLELLAYTAVVTVCVSALSWHLVEKPINGLKRRFPFGPQGISRERPTQASQPV